MNKVSIKKLHAFLGHHDSVYTLEALDDQRFVSVGGDGIIALWDLKNPYKREVIVKIPGSIYSLVFDVSDKFLYISQNNQGVHKIDLSRKKKVTSVSLGTNQIFDMKIIKEKIWVGLSSGELVLLSKNLQVLYRSKCASGRIRTIESCKKEVAVGGSDHIIRIIDPQTMTVKRELTGHKNSVFSLKYHPSGKYLVSVGRDAYINVWDTSENYILRESIAGHLYTINDVIFRRDGRYFVTASMDKSVKIWDAYNFKLLKILDKDRYEGHKNSVNKLLWMNYRDLLVTCSDDRSVSVWEIEF